MKQIELLIYLIILVFIVTLVLKYWKTGRKS
jgi:hypothetical protein